MDGNEHERTKKLLAEVKSKMELTRKSVKDLNNRYAGCGILYVKTSDSEIQIIEFGLGRNGKFYTIHGIELPVSLEELSREIEVRRVDG